MNSLFPHLALAALLLSGCAEGDPARPDAAPERLVPAFSHQLVPGVTSNAFDGVRLAIESTFAPRLEDLPGEELAGEIVHVGLGCPELPDPRPEDPYLADPAGKIALIERGQCRFDNKVARAQLAGAIGVLIYSFDENPVAMGGDSPVQVGGASVIGTVITIPALMVANSTGLLLRDGVPPVTVVVSPAPPPTPGQLLDHVYESVDVLVLSGQIDENLAKSLKAQLDATRRHIDRGNHKGAANTLNAFINHVNSLQAEGVLSASAAFVLRNRVQVVLDAL